MPDDDGIIRFPTSAAPTAVSARLIDEFERWSGGQPPTPEEAHDAARLASRRYALDPDAASPTLLWINLDLDEQTRLAVDALSWLRAAREIGLAR